MKNKNKPAFPNDKQYQLSGDDYEGLTKREYFAAKAMEGILSNPNRSSLFVDGFAKQAVDFADNLLKELENESKDK